MRVSLFYAPYPGQKFRGSDLTISPVRVRNPKSALPTLAAGARQELARKGIDVEFRIIDTQLADHPEEYYASFDYGPKVIDCYRYGGPFEMFDDDILQSDVIGISNNFTNSARVVADFARHVRRVRPTTVLVAGGMDVTARPEWYIDQGFDIVTQLEGELSLAAIVEAIVRGVSLDQLVHTRKHGNGTVVVSAPQLNLDELPPMALDLIPQLSLYNDTGEGTPPPSVRSPFACFETSRGCYRTCSFCATPMRGHYRYMTPSVVRRHFEYFRAHGIQNILFQEDNILSRMQRSGRGTLLHDSGRDDVFEIFGMAREFGFSWEFANGLEFGKFLDRGSVDTDLMEVLFWNDRAGDTWRGCYRVQIPLEYLGEDPTKKFRKLRSFEEQFEIVSAMLHYGITYQTFNVLIGHDNDDHAACDLYLDRCLQLKAELERVQPDAVAYFNVFNRTLLPGTADFRNKSQRLEFDIEQTPEVISVYLSPMPSDHLSYYELLQERIRMTDALNGDLIEQYDGTLHAPLADTSTHGLVG
jgi:hypothetical protein